MNCDWSEHATHEVPTGVLHGHDGASPSQCEELLAHVDEFEVREGDLGVLEDHTESIQEWRYYFAGYRECLQNRGQFDNFAQHLDVNPAPTS